MRLPNGYGSVHRLPGNRRRPFRARVTIGYKDNGTPIYDVIGFYENRTQGFNALAEYHKDPYMFKMERQTLRDVYDIWHKEKENSNVTNKLLDKDEWAFGYCNKIENMKFKDIKLSHLKKVINDIDEDKYETKRKVKSVLKQLYDYARANDITTKDYPNHIKLEQPEDKEEMHRPFTKEEKQLLWDNINIPYVDVVLVYIYTGFRTSELLDIKKDTGVNLEERYLKGGAKTKAGKNRIVPIHPRIYPIIEKWYNSSDCEYLINLDDHKMKYCMLEYRFRRTIKKLKLDHKPYDTRHTFGTDLDNLGANKVTIQRLMGHQSENITDKVYTHKDIEELRKAIELLP